MHDRKPDSTILFGVGLSEPGSDRVQIGICLIRRDSLLQMSNRLKYSRAISSIAQDVFLGQLFGVHDRNIERRHEKQYRPAEVRRRDADNRKRMFVHLHDAADYGAVALKMTHPIRMTQNDVRGAVGTLLIRGMQ